MSELRIMDISDYKIHNKIIKIQSKNDFETSIINYIKYILDFNAKCKYFVTKDCNMVTIQIPFIYIGEACLISSEIYDEISNYDEVPCDIIDDYLNKNKLIVETEYKNVLRMYDNDYISEELINRDVSLVKVAEASCEIGYYSGFSFLDLHNKIKELGGMSEYMPSKGTEYLRVPYVEDIDNIDNIYLLTTNTRNITKANYSLCIMTGILIKSPEELTNDIDTFLF